MLLLARPLCLLLVLLSFAAQIEAREQEVLPSSQPIVLDVGHSQPRFGATSARGVKEYAFNADLARQVMQALQGAGFTEVILLDSGKKKRSPQERTRLAARHDARLLLSIHHDSVQPHYLKPWTFEGKELRYCNRFQGYSLFYSEKNPRPQKSLELARSIGEALRLASFTPTAHHSEPIKGENRDFVDPQRGVYRFDDLLVLKTATSPAVLLEAGIIVNSIEERALQNPVRQQRMAQAIASGIARYLGVSASDAPALHSRPTPLR